jgi:GNAT superfamily N-acetyltransferase
MTLESVDHRRGTADKYSWMPAFDPEVAYEHSHWWDEVRYLEDDPWFVQVLEGGVEVARVELVEGGGLNTTYAGVPVIGDERLMIHLIEVATAARRRGIGTRVVRGLAARHPDRRLFAYSEGADDFWGSLGWERFNDPQPGPSRTLFIQPAP